MSSSPYNQAGGLLNEHLEKRRLKSIAFDTTTTTGSGKRKKGAPNKATYATVCKTMQHLSAINEILDANNKKLRRGIGFDAVRNKGLLYVCIYELLFGKYKSIRGGGKVKRMIVKYERELRREAEDYVSKHGSVEDSGGGKVNFPRYIRVNTLRSPRVSEIVEKLKGDLSAKAVVVEGEDATTVDQSEDTKDVPPDTTIYVDAHVPDLLVLPPTASSLLHRDHYLVKSGKVVLQDKSSCFSALAMVRGHIVGSEDGKEEKIAEPFDYIDACAAPGNKTSHLAALVRSSLGDDDDDDGTAAPKKKKKKGKAKNKKPKSTVFAFERNSTRFAILEERMKLFVPPPTSENNGNNGVAVHPIHGDFLRSDPSDPRFANVRAIMLDPSCSGSGIVNSPDRWMEEGDDGAAKKDGKRIESLSNFQLVALKHAMSFPNVDRIVYSTCSVHEEENEGVVSKALSEAEYGDSKKEEDGDNVWELAAPKCLENWKRRGKEGGIGGLTKAQADCLVRCDGLDGDETNGFFVSYFVRKRVRSSVGPETLGKAIECTGIPVYAGQFVDSCKKKGAPAKVASEPKKDNATDSSKQAALPGKKQKQQQGPTKKKEVTPYDKKLTDKRSAKKREKKLAWKRKQALQKGQRLKKKEEGSKVPTNNDGE